MRRRKDLRWEARSTWVMVSTGSQNQLRVGPPIVPESAQGWPCPLELVEGLEYPANRSTPEERLGGFPEVGDVGVQSHIPAGSATDSEDDLSLSDGDEAKGVASYADR